MITANMHQTNVSAILSRTEDTVLARLLGGKARRVFTCSLYAKPSIMIKAAGPILRLPQPRLAGTVQSPICLSVGPENQLVHDE